MENERQVGIWIGITLKKRNCDYCTEDAIAQRNKVKKMKTVSDEHMGPRNKTKKKNGRLK